MQFFERLAHDGSMRFATITGFLIGLIAALIAMRVIQFAHGS
jgi:hypothetical protein